MTNTRLAGCLSAGPCQNCRVAHGKRVPLLASLGVCLECGTKLMESLPVTCCDATREEWEANRACRACRAVAAAKAQ